MSTTATAARPAEPRRGVARVLLLVFGSLLGLVAFALLAAGAAVVWADQTQRDASGYFTTSFERYDTPLHALSYESIEIGDVADTPEWFVDRLGTVRVQASSGSERELFVGIGPGSSVAAYLEGVGHDEVTDRLDPDDLRTTPGGAPASAPGEQGFWAASTTGRGHESLTWDVDAGTWSLVVMNADGSRPVAAEVQLGANPDGLLGLGLVLLAIGLVGGAGAAAMIAFGVRDGGGGGAVGAATAVPLAPGATTYPVAVEARLEEPLSRWLWLVKWALAIPHFLALVFLWAALAVLTVVAWFAILFTGRYPRTLSTSTSACSAGRGGSRTTPAPGSAPTATRRSASAPSRTTPRRSRSRIPSGCRVASCSSRAGCWRSRTCSSSRSSPAGSRSAGRRTTSSGPA